MSSYKAACGCEIHVAQWTAKRKLVSHCSCPMHKHAKEMLDMLRDMYERVECICNFNHLTGNAVPCQTYRLGNLIYKVEGRGMREPLQEIEGLK